MHRPVANLVLALATVITLLAYPWRDHMWWGLVFHVAGAATIGGLADWYAVTALFKKPLGIPFKTALIPRQKERLVRMASTMLSEELLRVFHMYHIIKREHVVVRLLAFFLSPKGKAEVRHVLHGMGDDLFTHIDWEPIRREINKTLSESVENWRITPLVILFGRTMLNRDTTKVFWLYFNRTCQHVLKSNQLRPYLLPIVEAILNRYSGASFARGFLLAFSDNLSPASLVDKLQDKAIDYLQANESLDSPLGRYVWGRILYFFNSLESNESWQNFIEDHKNKWFRLFLEQWESRLLDGSQVKWDQVFDAVLEKAEGLGQEILEDPSKQVGVERFLLFRLLPILRNLHGYIGQLVGQELEGYSGQDLSRLVRTRLYDDLQIVRINGSLVGAVLGGTIYLLTSLLKGVI